MTTPEREGLREAVVASEDMAQNLRRLAERLRSDEVTSRHDDDPIERRHAFLRMFEQLYDVTSRRLFRGALLLAREDYRRLSYKEIVRRLETLDILADGDAWLNAGDARNILVHGYAVSAEAFDIHVAPAFDHLDLVLRTHGALTRHLRAEGLFA